MKYPDLNPTLPSIGLCPQLAREMEEAKARVEVDLLATAKMAGALETRLRGAQHAAQAAQLLAAASEKRAREVNSTKTIYRIKINLIHCQGCRSLGTDGLLKMRIQLRHLCSVGFSCLNSGRLSQSRCEILLSASRDLISHWDIAELNQVKRKWMKLRVLKKLIHRSVMP